VATLGVTVHREPWVDATQMPELMASADVVALPSLPTPYWEEQLGFAAIEAMASAVPVVATASGSIPFVVGGGGLLVPPYDVDALAGAIHRLAGDPDLRRRLGAAGRDRVERTLNTATVAAALGAIIDEVAAGALR
jgi:glycosyltransferase involved in cell wall biosynthesis